MNNRPHLDQPFDSSNRNLGDTKKGYAVPNNSVYTKEIWNEAIEAAALIADEADEIAARDIRKLKK